jgi:hypothetical protein
MDTYFSSLTLSILCFWSRIVIYPVLNAPAQSTPNCSGVLQLAECHNITLRIMILSCYEIPVFYSLCIPLCD